MPIISYLHPLGFSRTNAVCSVTVQCQNCKAQKNASLTLTQLKNLMDDYTIINDAQGAFVWAWGTTRLLKCPKCAVTNLIRVAVHKGGFVLVGNPDIAVRDSWWVAPPLPPVPPRIEQS